MKLFPWFLGHFILLCLCFFLLFLPDLFFFHVFVLYFCIYIEFIIRLCTVKLVRK